MLWVCVCVALFVCWDAACGLGVSAMLRFVYVLSMLCESFMEMCLFINFSCCALAIFVGLLLSSLAILLSDCVPIGSMYLFISDLRSACARLSVFSGGATPGVSDSFLLASEVLACVSFVSVGSYGGVLFALFGWLVGLFSTHVRERDVNKHTQQARAVIARQAGIF